MPDQKKTAGDVLIYTGGATTREITREQWEAAGVKDQDTVRFSKEENNRRVPVDEMTSAAVELLLDRHSNEFMLNEFKIPAPNGE